MAGAGRTLTIYLAADTKRAARQVDTFGAKLKTFAKVGAVAAAAGMAVLAAKTADFAKEAIDAASDFEEVSSKVGVIFGKKGAREIQEWASTAAKSFGQSTTAALDAASTFAVFGKSAKLRGAELREFSTSATELASDLASFHNVDPATAVEKLGAALRGESEPIRSMGVLLNDATLKARAFKMGLIETEKDALTPGQKVLAAYAEVMAQTKDAQGDFARTSDGLANSQRSLSAQWDDIKTKVGQTLLPAFTDIVKAINDNLIPAFQEVWEVVAPEVKKALGKVSAWFTETGAPAIKRFAEWLTTDGKQAWADMAGYVGDVADATDDVVTQVNRLADVFGGDGGGDGGGLIGLLSKVNGWLYDNELLWFGWKRIPGIVEKTVDVLETVWGWLTSIGSWMANADENMERWWRDIGQAITDGFTAGVQGLTSPIAWVTDKLGSLPAIVKGGLGIQSPSRVFIEIGGNIVKGFEIGVSGLKGVSEKVADRFKGMADTVNDRIATMVDNAKERLRDAKEAFADFARGVSDDLTGAFQFALTESGGLDAAATSVAALEATKWATYLRDIANNPAYSDALVTRLADMGPAAGIAFVDSLTPAMVTQLNTQLANTTLIADEAAAAMAERFKGQGVKDAQAHMDGLKERIDEKLDWLYNQGKRMGLAVSRGYRDATAALLESGAGAARSDTRSGGQTVNVTVQAGIGNPIEIARTIENVLAAKAMRLGV